MPTAAHSSTTPNFRQLHEGEREREGGIERRGKRRWEGEKGGGRGRQRGGGERQNAKSSTSTHTKTNKMPRDRATGKGAQSSAPPARWG